MARSYCYCSIDPPRTSNGARYSRPSPRSTEIPLCSISQATAVGCPSSLCRCGASWDLNPYILESFTDHESLLRLGNQTSAVPNVPYFATVDGIRPINRGDVAAPNGTSPRKPHSTLTCGVHISKEPLVCSIYGDTLIMSNIFRESPQVYLANGDWRMGFSLASTFAYKTFGVAISFSALLVYFRCAFTTSPLTIASRRGSTQHCRPLTFISVSKFSRPFSNTSFGFLILAISTHLHLWSLSRVYDSPMPRP